MWSPQAGNVSFPETIEASGGLCERVLSLVTAIGWHGLFELELIEPGDGRIGAIDFNRRPYGSLWLGVAADAPLAAIWCRWALGQAGAGMHERSDGHVVVRAAELARDGVRKARAGTAEGRR